VSLMVVVLLVHVLRWLLLALAHRLLDLLLHLLWIHLLLLVNGSGSGHILARGVSLSESGSLLLLLTVLVRLVIADIRLLVDNDGVLVEHGPV
jgi:hypothetical protein